MSGSSKRLVIRCPVCHEVFAVSVDWEKVKSDPSGVLTLPIIHEAEGYAPHLIVISIDPHGFIRSAYLYRKLIKPETAFEDRSKVADMLKLCKEDAISLIKSGSYDIPKDFDKLYTAFRIKYNDDIYNDVLGREIGRYLWEKYRGWILKFGGKFKDDIQFIINSEVIPILKKLKIKARIHNADPQALVIESSNYPLSLVRGIVDGILLRIMQSLNINYTISQSEREANIIRIRRG